MREKVAAKSGEKRSFSNYCKNEVKPIVTHGPQPADSRQRNHKLKLVLPGYNFPRISAERKKERRRERSSVFPGLLHRGRFSTVDESFIAMVCPAQTVDPSLHRPWNRPTSRIIASEISMVSPLSFVPVLLLFPPSLSLFFLFRKTKISSKDITLITNSYEIVEGNDFVDGSVFEVRQLFRILINIGNRSRLRSIKQNVSRIPR